MDCVPENTEAKITALCVTRNRRSFIERCIMCLYKTTMPENLLIYIWDNASEDDTPEYLATLKNCSTILPMQSRQNIGTRARQEMLKLVKTPYILTIDDDAWISTSKWDVMLIKAMELDPTLGAATLGQYIDERSRFGITWEKQDYAYDEFREPRFQYENLIDSIPISGPFDPETDLYKVTKNFNGVRIVPENNLFPITFGGFCTLWRIEPLKGYEWKGHAGIMSDMAGEWEPWIKNKGYYIGIVIDVVVYHAVGPWWHLPQHETSWKEKCRYSPTIYKRSGEEQWKWYEQARVWSGWGSGIPDANVLLGVQACVHDF
jgi:glycosyltransferase involved in cell wall biosynthesis